MKSTGIIRRIDALGRVVLPMELRRSLGWREQDRVEIFTEGEQVVLRRFEPNCSFCGRGEELTEFHGKPVCAKCIRELQRQL